MSEPTRPSPYGFAAFWIGMTSSLLGLLGVIVMNTLIFVFLVHPSELDILFLPAGLLICLTVLGATSSMCAVALTPTARAVVALVISMVSVIASFCNLAVVYLHVWAAACV